MNKEISPREAMSHIKSGMSVMVSGFMAVKSPETILDLMIDDGIKDLTVICNDAGIPSKGVGKLVHNHRVRKLYASHIGLNPESGKQMTGHDMVVELVPQGTLAERIRCAGAGIGGFYTPTGVGTEVGEGKEHKFFDGKEYLLERPLSADIALIKASVVDRYGNAFYRGTSKNFSIVMATAAEYVVVEADMIVDQLDPEQVHTPGVFVDAVVLGDEKYRIDQSLLKESIHV